MRAALILSAAGLAAAASTPALAQQATFIPLEAGYTQAFAVSNDGNTAVGRIPSSNPNAWDAACRWVNLVPMGQELGHLPGTDDSVAFGVSADGGVIVGASGLDYFDYGYAFRYHNGVMQSLGRLPGGTDYCIANAVSADGSVIVGEGDNPNWFTVAWRKVGAGAMQVLGPFPNGGFETWALGVSADGSVIVGAGYDAAESLQGWTWTAPGGMQPLPRLPDALESQAFGVSDNGQIVFGAALIDPFESEQAVVWAETGMQRLEPPAGYDGAVAYASNADGSVIVGNMWHDIFVPEAMIYEAGSGMRTLQEVLLARGATIPQDWTITHAWDISADGRVVVGQAINELGETQGYIATLFAPPVGGACGPADFNGDGDVATDQDIEAFFACLGGNCCTTCWSGGADFNGDGDVATDQDIEAFFRVFGGQSC